MAVNHEIKSHLARLLATEDLVVEHRKVSTASFNVHTRVLTLPMWEKASNIVYDLLVGHEVGHALYTPDENWIKHRKISPQFVNIVEDVRIEKMMKRRYPGLSKSFFNGYKELSEEDFFNIQNKDVKNFNLADRANLFFKIGNFLNLTFTNEEKTIIDQIASTETFAEVLDAAEVLYKYCKKYNKKEYSNLNIVDNLNDDISLVFDDQEDSEDSSVQEDSEDSSDQEDSEDFDGEEDSEDFDGEENPGDSGDDEYEPEVETADSLEEALKNLIDDSKYENIYLEFPELNLEKIIAPNTEIHHKCKNHWNSYGKDCELFSKVDLEFVNFKRSAQKEVNYLIKEFECRKAADSYARSTVSQTGLLDCSRLHTYKYNEDLFKKVATLSEGKNHGLVFILDWSGSMKNMILDTVKQLFNLIWFCKKVSIPFEVYAFTLNYPMFSYDNMNKGKLREISHQKKEHFIEISERFTLMNIFTSAVNVSTLDDQMKNIFRIAWKFQNYDNDPRPRYSIPAGFDLSGTPLNETLIALHQILPKFKRAHKLQKVQCVILTDGEGTTLKYYREVIRKWESEPYLGTAHVTRNSFIRDRKTGNTYSMNCEWWQVTDVILRNLRDKFHDINFIGIRIIDKNFSRFIARYYDDQYDIAKIMNIWKKERAFSLKESGYHTYFGIASNALSKDSEFFVDENANKTEIKKAFVQSLKTKKMNKKMLSEFIGIIV